MNDEPLKPGDECYLAQIFFGVYLRPDGAPTIHEREARQFRTKKEAQVFAEEWLTDPT